MILENQIVEFLVLSLVTWRLSNLLMFESGPFGVIDKLRHYLGVREAYSPRGWQGFISELFGCMYCFSVWTGVALALSTGHGLLTGLAASAACIIIEKHLSKPEQE